MPNFRFIPRWKGVRFCSGIRGNRPSCTQTHAVFHVCSTRLHAVTDGRERREFRQRFRFILRLLPRWYASSMYPNVASIAALVPWGTVYVGIVEYFELFVRDNIFPLLSFSLTLFRPRSLNLPFYTYIVRHLRVQGSSVRVRLILPRWVFTGKWVLSTDGGLVPG